MQYKQHQQHESLFREMNTFDRANGTKLPTNNVYEESYQIGDMKIRYFLNKTNISLIGSYSYE